MYSVTRLLDVSEPDRDRLLREFRCAATGIGAPHWVVQPTLPGTRNGGDMLVHLRFHHEDHWRCRAARFDALLTDPAVARVNGANYSGAPQRCAEGPGTVYRTLLLRVAPDIPATTVASFERELALMPRHIPAIRAWQLSRVSEAIGGTGWTHVFEQEFADVDGLMGPYLWHPIHWAVVDRWFDPETTDVVVRDRVCHSFCAIGDRVLG
ncbi:MAG: Dabb family protein [Mycobacterium sp.]|uniref:Dabb family protein n=1 Tax=Mycobacterium sp. TaxID=1785 RepID=UPI001ED78607|nr:Dabb family protein [Mycobacterium sp.]MBV8785853.1 Dabb family protein [Mycobacterium sp.]